MGGSSASGLWYGPAVQRFVQRLMLLLRLSSSNNAQGNTSQSSLASYQWHSAVHPSRGRRNEVHSKARCCSLAVGVGGRMCEQGGSHPSDDKGVCHQETYDCPAVSRAVRGPGANGGCRVKRGGAVSLHEAPNANAVWGDRRAARPRWPHQCTRQLRLAVVERIKHDRQSGCIAHTARQCTATVTAVKFRVAWYS